MKLVLLHGIMGSLSALMDPNNRDFAVDINFSIIVIKRGEMIYLNVLKTHSGNGWASYFIGGTLAWVICLNLLFWIIIFLYFFPPLYKGDGQNITLHLFYKHIKLGFLVLELTFKNAELIKKQIDEKNISLSLRVWTW